MRRCFFQAGLFLFLPASLWGAGITYNVEFEGLHDQRALRTLRSISQLVALRKKPPASVNALRFRAESDVPELIHALHSHGYLEAEVEVIIAKEESDYSVTLMIHPGPLYRIEEFSLIIEGETPGEIVDCPDTCFKNLGISINDPLETNQIIDSELCALEVLSEWGYPLAIIKKREIIADGKTKRVKILITIEAGPLASFGPSRVEGNTSVHYELIDQQIQWCDGDRYDSCLVEGTQQGLMDTGLFSSVYITHADQVKRENELPMKIEVAETKHKSISLGASYQKTFGGGVSFGWENRNVGGMGRKLLLQADIAQRSHSGIASYLIPNFQRMGQSIIIQGQAFHESIKPYKMQSYSLFGRFDRQVDDCLFFGIGPRIEYMMVQSSVDNGNFLLLEAPLYLRWTNVKDCLNPISGLRVEYRGTPAINSKDTSDFYYSQLLTVSSYFPFGREEGLVLAQKMTIGTIFSNGIGAIPVPNRFFGGSEINLRGYKYYTVSPLTDNDKPIGGRSAIYYTVEPRFRISHRIGIVPFFDVGNVYLTQLPKFTGKWRKSVGIGLRYFSFIGPIRIDLAFPLNRREGIDPHWWIFASLGQTF
ncbi:MAG: Translocation and assembly module TamA [Chlamydiae bacterium]|nr:Translocation and assembly module TamA [Chlamydiota bacterium]